MSFVEGFARLIEVLGGVLRTRMVDAAGDSAMDETNDAVRVNIVAGSSSGTEYNQGTVAGATDAMTMAGAIRRDTAALDAGVIDGDRAALSTDSAGRMRVTAVDTTQPVSGTVTANAGTNLNTSALLTTTAHDAAFGTAGTADVQVRSVQGVAGMTPVDVNSELPAAAAIAADNQVAPTAPAVYAYLMGFDGTNWDRVQPYQAPVDDAAFTVATDRVLAMGALVDETLPDSADEGDIGIPRMTADRKQLIRLVGATDANRADVDSSGRLNVTLGTAIPAGTNNIGDVDVLTVPAPLSTTGGGTEATALRVTVASDSTGLISVDDNAGSLTVDVGTALPAGDNNIGNVDVVTLPNVTLAAGTNTNEVVGDVAHDAGIAGNPVLVCGAAQTMDDTAPPNRVSAESDATRVATDLDGGIFAHPPGPQVWSYHENSSSALTDTAVHAAPGVGLSLYVTDIVCSTGAATAMNIFFEEGASTVLGPYYLEAVAGRGVALHFQTPKKITANTALAVTTSAAIAHSIDVTGFTAPA